MGLYVLIFCALLVVLLSVIKQWKLLVLLALITAGSASVLLWYSFTIDRKDNDKSSAEKEIETVHILYGIEKMGILKDPEFQEILRKKHRLFIKGSKIEGTGLPEGPVEGIDGLWPSTKWTVTLFHQQHPDLEYKAETIFSTPLMFFSWKEISDVLIRLNIAEKRGSIYKLNLKKLLKMRNRTWESVRLFGQKGYITFLSAAPGESSSGLLTAALIAASVNNGNVPEMKDIEPYLSEIKKIYDNMERVEESADTLFNLYLKQGQGIFPLITGCENQIIEFYQTHQSYQKKIRGNVRVLIPDPMLMSEHPFIALTEKGEKLLSVLREPEILKFAWQRFGFRFDQIQSEDVPEDMKLIGIPGKIESLIPEADPEVMAHIADALGKKR